MKKRYVLKNKRRFSTFIIISVVIITTFVLALSVQGYKEPTYTQITVQTGDSLWSLADKYYKSGDIRKNIYEIKKVNKLSNSEIYAGDTLLLPQK